MRLKTEKHQILFLYAGFALILLAFVALAFAAVQQVTNVNHSLATTTASNDEQLAAAMTMRVAVRERAIILWHMTLLEDPFDRDELYQEFLLYGSRFGHARNRYLGSQLTDQEKSLLKSLDEETGARAPQLRDFADQLMQGDSDEDYIQQLDGALSDQIAVSDILDQIIHIQQFQNEHVRQANNKETEHIVKMMLLGMVLIILFGITFARKVVSAATSQIRQLEETKHELAHANRELKLLARHDHLTGLPNRLYLMEHLEMSLALCQRHGQKGALLFIDLDEFKPINDTYGHDVGDLYLQRIAKEMSALSRGSDLLSRLGGDEFVLMLFDVPSDQEVIIVAERVLRTLSASYELAKGIKVNASASIGICYFPRPGFDMDADDVISCADTAMYTAKAEGKNRYHIYHPEGGESMLANNAN